MSVQPCDLAVWVCSALRELTVSYRNQRNCKTISQVQQKEGKRGEEAASLALLQESHTSSLAGVLPRSVASRERSKVIFTRKSLKKMMYIYSSDIKRECLLRARHHLRGQGK